MTTPAGPGMPTRWEADADRVALLLPGGEYTPARPLLHFARAVLLRHGWTVQELWWPDSRPRESGQLPDWVYRQTAAALDAESAQHLLLVGKSLGTFGALVAAERAIPAVWLTPVLSNPRLVGAIADSSAPTLLVGGTADPLWNTASARGSGHPFLEIPGADHGLETDADPVNSAEILKQVTARIDAFVAGL